MNLVLKIDRYPPSVNRLYSVVRGRKILSQEARAYKRYIKLLLAEQMIQNFETSGKFRFHYVLFGRWINKGWPKTKTKFRRFDISNRLKCLEDAICEGLGIDDSQVFQIEIEKREDERERIEVRILCVESGTA